MLNDVREILHQHKIEAYFGAYDYDIPHAKRYIPSWPKDFPPRNVDTLPLFYELHPDDDQNPPNPLGPERFLHDRAHTLDKGRLFREKSRALWRELSRKVHEGIELIQRYAQRQEETIFQFYDDITLAYLQLLGQTTDQGRIVALQLDITSEMAQQLTESLVRTAPWYLRPSLFVNQQFREVRQWLSTARSHLSQLNPLSTQRLKAKAEAFIRGNRGVYMTPETLARAFRARGLSELCTGGHQAFHTTCQDIIERFQKENTTTFDHEKLDQACTAMWLNLPTKQKMKGAVAAVGTLTVSLAVLVLIPIDAGGTAVLTTTLGQLLLGEIGIAAGSATVIGLLVGTQAMKDAEQEAALVQFGDWFAVTCDVFGLPRGMDGRPLQIEIDGRTIAIPASQIPPQSSQRPPMAVLRVDNGFRARVESFLQGLEGAGS